MPLDLAFVEEGGNKATRVTVEKVEPSAERQATFLFISYFNYFFKAFVLFKYDTSEFLFLISKLGQFYCRAKKQRLSVGFEWKKERMS